MTSEDARDCFDLFATEVLPELRRHDVGGDLGVPYGATLEPAARGRLAPRQASVMFADTLNDARGFVRCTRGRSPARRHETDDLQGHSRLQRHRRLWPTAPAASHPSG